VVLTTTEPTQVRLLDATERLVGTRGIDAVSLRAINTEAGTNVAAVHYHFGSKEALVRAVLERRMSALAQQRATGFDALDAEPAPTARAVATVFVDPLVDLAGDPDGDPDGVHYVRFLAALYRAEGPWLRVLEDAFAPQSARITPLLARALPALDADRRARRLDIASETMLRMLADADRYAGTLDPDAYRAEVIDTFTAILVGSPKPQEAP
jgi:AcrR family transcriptional regulator